MTFVTGNETDSPPAPSPEDVPARTLFHLSLILPVIGSGPSALAALAAPASTPLQRKWKRLMLALFIVDLLVVACFIGMSVRQFRLGVPPTAGKASPAPRIGITRDPDPAKTEARVDKVLPGSPAERAGLQSNDLVEKIDGNPVATWTELQESIQNGAPGVARTLTVRRGDRAIDVTVTPELPPKETRGLFEARPGPAPTNWVSTLLGFLPAVLLVIVAALVGRRKRRADVLVWRGFLLASIGSFAAAAGTVYLFRAIQGGGSLGALLLSLNAQMVVLLGLSTVATWWCGKDVPAPADPLPPLSNARAALLGAYYLITGFPRLSILLMTLDQLLLGGATAARTQGLEMLARSPLGVGGTALFVFVVVFLGPLAEERLFRGFLVPRLAALWGSVASMGVSAALFALFHPHYGLFAPIVLLYGYVFAWVRLRTGRLLVPVLLHMLVNGLVTTVVLLKS